MLGNDARQRPDNSETAQIRRLKFMFLGSSYGTVRAGKPNYSEKVATVRTVGGLLRFRSIHRSRDPRLRSGAVRDLAQRVDDYDGFRADLAGFDDPVFHKLIEFRVSDADRISRIWNRTTKTVSKGNCSHSCKLRVVRAKDSERRSVYGSS
jgi:hypothetical protein